MSNYPFLPALLAEIAEAAGLPAALAIAEAKGGQRVHFPARARDDHWLVQTVGREAATKLCTHFRTTARGGIYLWLPLGPKNFYKRARCEIERRIEAGESIEAASAAVGVHARSGYRYARRLRDVKISAQLKLL